MVIHYLAYGGVDTPCDTSLAVNDRAHTVERVTLRPGSLSKKWRDTAARRTFGGNDILPGVESFNLTCIAVKKAPDGCRHIIYIERPGWGVGQHSLRHTIVRSHHGPSSSLGIENVIATGIIAQFEKKG